MSDETIRAFICIDFPDDVVKEIARIQGLIEGKIKFVGKVTEPENLHLTLKFLGEINEEKLTEVKKRLSEVRFEKMDLHLEKIGTFNYQGMPRIVWVKVAGGAIGLQKKIDEALLGLFPKEERFMSHATIARVKYTVDLNHFFGYLKNLKIKKIKFTTDCFKLNVSELRMTGPVYRTIDEYKAQQTL